MNHLNHQSSVTQEQILFIIKPKKKKIQSKKPKWADWGGRKGGQKGRQWKSDWYGRKREKEGWGGREEGGE